MIWCGYINSSVSCQYNSKYALISLTLILEVKLTFNYYIVYHMGLVSVIKRFF